jgi:hypothetical protein
MLDLADTRQQKAIQITGREPQKAIRLQLAQLRTEGILVDLNITGTGMFQRTPNWIELGIPEFTNDKRTSQFTKGSKYLYPEAKVAKIKSFESRLRQNLDKHTFDVTGFRPFRWLPYTAYAAWRAKHDQIVKEANEFIQTEILDCHDECVDYVAAAFTEIAEAAWIGATSGENDKGQRRQLYKYVQIWDKESRGNKQLDHEAFVSYIVSLAISQVPTVEDIMNKLSFDYTTALIYGQEDIAADEAAAENIRAQVSFEKEKAQLELSMTREQARKQAWDIQQDQRSKEEMLEAMRIAEYEHHKEKLRETVSPFVEVYRQAMFQFIGHAKDMLESIQKNKHVRGKVAERGRGLLDIYNLLVIPGMGDEQMMKCLKDLRDLIGTESSEARDTSAITSKLEEIVKMEKEIAADLLSVPTTFSYLEI